jgi:hypothetical protein
MPKPHAVFSLLAKLTKDRNSQLHRGQILSHNLVSCERCPATEQTTWIYPATTSVQSPVYENVGRVIGRFGSKSDLEDPTDLKMHSQDPIGHGKQNFAEHSTTVEVEDSIGHDKPSGLLAARTQGRKSGFVHVRLTSALLCMVSLVVSFVVLWSSLTNDIVSLKHETGVRLMDEMIPSAEVHETSSEQVESISATEEVHADRADDPWRIATPGIATPGSQLQDRNASIATPLPLTCNPGTQPRDDKSSCEPCATFGGNRYSSDGGQCQECAAGFQANENRTSCEACSAVGPSYISEEGEPCRSCSVGKQPRLDRTGCDICDAGRFSDSTLCNDCPAGQIDHDSNATTACENCTAGFFSSDPAETSCTQCALGTYSPTGSGRCEDCAAGRYMEVSSGSGAASDCIECVAGKYLEHVGSDAASDCIACPAGRYVDVAGSDAASDCIGCGAGRYLEHTGSFSATDCIECGVGKYAQDRGNVAESDCIECATGKYLQHTGSDTASDCIDCVEGKFSDGSACVPSH